MTTLSKSLQNWSLYCDKAIFIKYSLIEHSHDSCAYYNSDVCIPRHMFGQPLSSVITKQIYLLDSCAYFKS